MDQAILVLDRFGVRFGEHQVLTNVTFSIPTRGVTVLLGPVSTGKSTLLRTLAGYNDTQPALSLSGQAWYAGHPLGQQDRPALMSQNARLMLDSVFENMASAIPERNTLTKLQQRELILRLLQRAHLDELIDQLGEEVIGLPLSLQRRLAVARTVAPNPYLLLLDEPTAGLSAEQAEPLLALICAEASRRAVLMVTHNQEHARALADQIVLLVGGATQEVTSASEFFSESQTEVGRQFLRTGSCSLPEPDYTDEPDVPEDRPVPEPSNIITMTCGPRGFRWLKPNQLAGTPRPGIVADVEYDLESLRRVGVTLLVTLEEEPFATELLATYQIKAFHFPIVDMEAPTVSAMLAFCKQVDRWLHAGEVVAVHCRAGLGRTGTVLACQLIWEGKSAREALERARQIEPRWVQSDAQVEHLREFFDVVSRTNMIR